MDKNRPYNLSINSIHNSHAGIRYNLNQDLVNLLNDYHYDIMELKKKNRNLKRAINIITSSKYGSLSKDSCKKLTDEEFKNIMQNDVYYKQIKEELSEEIKEVKTKLNSVYGINGAKQLAIDELEKAKINIEEKLNNINSYDGYMYYDTAYTNCIDIIDEQIELLKGDN